MPRYLIPAERVKTEKLRERDGLLEERARVAGPFHPDKRARLAEVEFEIEDVCRNACDAGHHAHNELYTIRCFRCGCVMDVKGETYYTYVLCAEVKHKKPDSNGTIHEEMEHFTPPTDLKVMRDAYGVVTLLEPPDAGELATCKRCREHIRKYIAAQEAG